MINKNHILFCYIFLWIVFHTNTSCLFARALPDFDFSVETRDESCSSDGEMKFSVNAPSSEAKITYSIFLKPDLNKPIKIQEEETLSQLSAGDYRVVAKVEIDGESRSQQVDVTIDHTYQPLEFNIISS